jgi:ABC-type antimicrobial peptide transport system permease subunit
VGFESLITSVIGSLCGIGLFALVRYLIAHLTTPRIVFSHQITKRFTVDREPVYELRVQNASRWRGVIDLRVSVSVISAGLKMFAGFLAVSSGFGHQVSVVPAWRVDEGVIVSLAA